MKSTLVQALFVFLGWLGNYLTTSGIANHISIAEDPLFLTGKVLGFVAVTGLILIALKANSK